MNIQHSSLVNTSVNTYVKSYADRVQTGAAGSSAKNSDVKDVAGAAKAQAPGQSAEKTAANILRHVTRSVQMLRDQGASPERIQQRIDAARTGIAAGYADARDMLDKTGKLDDDLKARIDEGSALIEEGLAQLEQGDVPDILTAKAPAPQASSAAGSAQFSASRQTQNSFSLNVVTNDGDQVQVTFNRASSMSASYDGSSAQFEASHSGEWSLSVNGDLDDGEMAALNQLMEDVSSISDSFFSGDLGGALSSAMELGLDGKELASMSLELKSRSVSSVSRAYGESGPAVPAPLQSVTNQLADYAEQYINALEKAGQLREPDNVFDQMMAKLMGEDRQYLGFKALNEGLGQIRNAG